MDEIGTVYAAKVAAICAELEPGVSVDTSTLVQRAFPKTVKDWELCRRTFYKLLAAPAFLAAVDAYWTRAPEPVQLWNGKMGRRRMWHRAREKCPHCSGTGFATPIADTQW